MFTRIYGILKPAVSAQKAIRLQRNEELLMKQAIAKKIIFIAILGVIASSAIILCNNMIPVLAQSDLSDTAKPRFNRQTYIPRS
jgi:hypothetical protein